MIEKEYNENSLVCLTERGKRISIDNVIVQYPNLILVGLITVLKKSESPLSIKNIFNFYMDNTNGNYGFLEYIIRTLIIQEFVELKE